MSYDTAFIFRECGFDWAPPHIDRSLLFNVSYDLATAAIKLYVLDASHKFLYKLSPPDSIIIQNDAQAIAADPAPLARMLGTDFDFTDLQLDTVEGDTYYLYIEESSCVQYVKFLDQLCAKLQFPKPQFLAAVNRINARPSASVFDCYQKRSISGVRVSLTGRNCKVYSRPFRIGNGFALPDPAVRFLSRLHACAPDQLAPHLKYLWVSSEILTNRTQITTQRQELLHPGE